MILDLIVGSLNLTAELPHLEAKGPGFVPSYQSLAICWGWGVKYRCDGGDGSDACGGAPCHQGHDASQ